ncbi:MAG: tungstate ABC transporter substrate-binding protein WtpA [Chloroflexota bacterium]
MKPKTLAFGLLLLILLLACGRQPATPSTQISTTAPAAQSSPTQTPAPKEKVSLKVFCAGSLIIPMDELEKAFESRYPNIDVLNECHGSIQVIRHVTELHQKIDVVATADHALIPMLMYTSQDPESGEPYAGWYIQFAGNRLALAYTGRSRYANEINAENWYEVLTRPGVKLGVADPRFDASGYRALMIIKLAEKVYNHPTLFASLFTGQFSMPITVLPPTEGVTVIQVPEIIQTQKDASIVIRGASIQLIALLESGDLDYAFEYESVIQQHNLQMVALPDRLNLGSVEQNPFYGQVQVRLDFQRFATVKPEFKGERIGYGITVPGNAPHPQEALQYIAFLLGPEGRQIMEGLHHPVFASPVGDHYAQIPASLQPLCVAGE